MLCALHSLAGQAWEPDDLHVSPVDIRTGPMMLDYHSELLLGLPAGKRSVRIMVTMPSEAAGDYALVRNLLGAGMDVHAHQLRPRRRARLAGHDQQPASRLRASWAARAKVYADLAGPKLRTGAIEPSAGWSRSGRGATSAAGWSSRPQSG